MKMEVEDIFSAPSTPSTVYGETKDITFEPHNLDNICRAARSLGDPNIVLSLQTGMVTMVTLHCYHGNTVITMTTITMTPLS